MDCKQNILKNSFFTGNLKTGIKKQPHHFVKICPVRLFLIFHRNYAFKISVSSAFKVTEKSIFSLFWVKLRAVPL